MRYRDAETPKIPFTVTVEKEFADAFRKYCKDNFLNSSAILNAIIKDYILKNNIKTKK